MADTTKIFASDHIQYNVWTLGLTAMMKQTDLALLCFRPFFRNFKEFPYSADPK